MARKRRGGRRGFRMGKWINLGFKVAGAVVAASPAINAVQSRMAAGAPGDIPRYILFNYTGYDIAQPAGSSNPNLAQTGGGAAAIIGGIVLAKVGSWLGRRF